MDIVEHSFRSFREPGQMLSYTRACFVRKITTSPENLDNKYKWAAGITVKPFNI